jgi:hypothetical protein
MKSLKIWSLAVALLMTMVACGGDKGNDTPNNNNNGGGNTTITGDLSAIEKEWKLVSVNGIENDFHVYISFSEGYFAMYQQVYTLDFQFYQGDYEASGQKLSGEYLFVNEAGDDVYEPWKCSYTGGISADGNTMTLVSNEEAPITCVYEACTIPEHVKEEALASTRSAEVLPFL